MTAPLVSARDPLSPRDRLRVVISKAFTAVLTGHDVAVLDEAAKSILAAADAYAAALAEQAARTPRGQMDPRMAS